MKTRGKENPMKAASQTNKSVVFAAILACLIVVGSGSALAQEVLRNDTAQTFKNTCPGGSGCSDWGETVSTEEPATLVRPPMVKESKVRIECRVLDTRSLGDQPGSGNLVICEALRMHIDDSILDPATGRIDQRRFPLVARLGEDWYCSVDPANLFRVEKPNIHLGIGIDALPPAIRQSRILTGNDLGLLANVHSMPVIDPAFEDERLRQIFQYYAVNPDEMETELHSYARQLLAQGKVGEAWQVLLALN